MAKRKKQRYAELRVLDNIIQPGAEYLFQDHPMRGNWSRNFFADEKPIVLELGCGRGEYTIRLAEKYPDKNFIGIDIKGARIWRGSKTALERGMKNAGFLRTWLEHIGHFFGPDEVSEIWITFPDPRPKKGHAKKRLSSSVFLNRYRQFLKPGGLIHLKTDNQPLFEFSLATIAENHCNIEFESHDLYGEADAGDSQLIQTTYEQKFLKQGKPICYVRFTLA